MPQQSPGSTHLFCVWTEPQGQSKKQKRAQYQCKENTFTELKWEERLVSQDFGEVWQAGSKTVSTVTGFN
jgi:hypothetical protein